MRQFGQDFLSTLHPLESALAERALLPEGIHGTHSHTVTHCYSLMSFLCSCPIRNQHEVHSSGSQTGHARYFAWSLCADSKLTCCKNAEALGLPAWQTGPVESILRAVAIRAWPPEMPEVPFVSLHARDPAVCCLLLNGRAAQLRKLP